MTRFVIAFLTLALLLGGSAPASTNAVPYSTWGKWSGWVYYTAGTKECARWRQTTAGKANAWPQCRVAQRARKRIANIAGSWDLGQIQMDARGPFSLFGVKNTSNYRYNGSRVYTDGQTNCSSWGAGYSVDLKWCATDNEGGRNISYLRVGFDWKVIFLYNGFPASAQHWSRAKVYINGSRWCCLGDHL